MNYFCVQSALVAGIQAFPVRIECAQTRRLPYLQILGAGGASAGELRERVIAALGTLEGGKYRLPARRFTVEISPAAQQLPLETLDLAVALALLGSAGHVPAESVAGLLICGRLGLDGGLKLGAPAAVLRRLLREGGFASALLPREGAEALEGGQLARGGGFAGLAEVVAFLRGGGARALSASLSPGEKPPFRESVLAPALNAELAAPPASRIRARIGGQVVGLRAIEISAAGAHHLLLPGPGGARADLLAHALSFLLPPLGEKESGEVGGIYALAGMGHVLPSRPFHALGSCPGLPSLLRDRRARGAEEVLLAHHGVLFVENACEREASVFPALLPAMLRGSVPARVEGRAGEVPADAIVVAATPGCACGAKGDPRLACLCRPTEAKRFEARWRRLFRYPFDLCLRLVPERAKACDEGAWRAAAGRVEEARARMRARQGKWNGRLGEEELAAGALRWSAGASRLREGLEARAGGEREGQGLVAAARVAATICDLRAGAEISESDLLEALHYLPGEGAPGAGRAASASAPEVNSTAMP